MTQETCTNYKSVEQLNFIDLFMLTVAELDRKVAEERRRLQEVREAVCRNIPMPMDSSYMPPVPPTAEKDCLLVRDPLSII